MIIVTGAAGFIGSNLIKALNERGHTNIIAVDDLTEGRKFANLADLTIADYLHHTDFRSLLKDKKDVGPVTTVFHQGACSDTTEWNGHHMLDTNFETSKEVFHWCQSRKISMVYASSAAVYGATDDFREDGAGEKPLNVYGWSKLLFDQWLRRRWSEITTPVIGLRYFNVYGPREAHKGRMASVIHHFDKQIRETGAVRLFAASHGYGDGEHVRDFVFVEDIVKVNLWAASSTGIPGIYNVGTGTARSFNDVARAVIGWHGKGTIEYIAMPTDLASAYQAFTKADETALRNAGYREPFLDIEEGVRQTFDTLAQQSA